MGAAGGGWPTMNPTPTGRPAAPRSFPDLQLLVYDMDGTLVDAFEDIWLGVNEVLARYGLPARDLAAVRAHVGDGARLLVERLLPPERRDMTEEVYLAYRRLYAEQPIRRAGLYPGVAETMDRLRARGVRQAILTNKPHEVARSICERLGLSGRIDGLWGDREGAPSKPDPEALRQIARHFGLDPSQCAMVGDGRPDCLAARGAGTLLFGVAWGQLTREQLAAERPDALLEHFSELEELVAPSPV